MILWVPAVIWERSTQGQAGWGSEHLMELWVSLCTAGEWDQMAFKGPFQLRGHCDSVVLDAELKQIVPLNLQLCGVPQ